ncbi:enediyne antibiotic chromoprotein [Amycolatopsis sp. NPDC059090]|uniref:enediyne antibiotic chromoprotein n=1 Tax=unclassified Amycolatopsis TaxID=2618356 RepID=UPI00366CF74A
MSSLGKVRLAVGAGAVVAAAAGLAVIGQPAVAAPLTSAVSVTPSAGLADGQSVNVAVSGFKAGVKVRVGMCAEVSPDVLACDHADGKTVVADASGAGATPLTVHKSFQGYRFDGTLYGTVNCTDNCLVGATDDSQTGAATAYQPVSFA